MERTKTTKPKKPTTKTPKVSSAASNPFDPKGRLKRMGKIGGISGILVFLIIIISLDWKKEVPITSTEAPVSVTETKNVEKTVAGPVNRYPVTKGETIRDFFINSKIDHPITRANYVAMLLDVDPKTAILSLSDSTRKALWAEFEFQKLQKR